MNENENNKEELIKMKFVVMGELNSGKTSLIFRFTRKESFESFAEESRMSLGSDFSQRTMSLEDKSFRIMIWDTCGEERFSSITRTYYRGCRGFLLTCDMTSCVNLSRTEFWLSEIRSNVPENIPILLVGTKCDLITEITPDILEQYALKKGINFIITSSKENINVEEAFLRLLKLSYENDKNEKNMIFLNNEEQNIVHKNEKKCI